MSTIMRETCEDAKLHLPVTIYGVGGGVGGAKDTSFHQVVLGWLPKTKINKSAQSVCKMDEQKTTAKTRIIKLQII